MDALYKLRTALGLFAVLCGFLVAAGDSREAATSGNFSAGTSISLSSHATGAVAEQTISLNIPGTDLNFNSIVLLSPQAAITTAGPPGQPGGAPILGDIVATYTSTVNLGLLNGSCNVVLSVPLVFMNATVDNSSLNLINPSLQSESSSGGPLYPLLRDTSPVSPGTGTAGPGSTFSPVNGLPGHVDLYPAYLNAFFDPDGPGGLSPLAPLARYSAGQIIASQAEIWTLAVFSPGALAAFSPPNPLSDFATTNLGYATVVVRNDPTQPGAPGTISDFCAPFSATITAYGESRTNPCNGFTASPCNTESGINNPSVGPATGRIRYANPSTSGQHYFGAFHQSLRDLDGDGYENALDTCPYNANVENPKVTAGSDGDMIDSACDPTPGVNTGSGNHDGDVAPNGSGWLNADDNCPLVANGTNAQDELTEVDAVARPRGGEKADALGNECDTAESSCGTAVDDDGDGLINDGCPAVGAAEAGCLNSADDDADGAFNDGCPSSSRVADGHFHTTFDLLPNCIGLSDIDGDGWCDSTESNLGSNSTNASSTPEHFAVHRIFPVAHSGSGSSPPASREPLQICSDGVDNDLDGQVDLLDNDGPDGGVLDDCNPQDYVRLGEVIPTTDSDGDGFTDLEEIHVGTDALGRCEKGFSSSPSGDWPADLVQPTSTSGDKVTIQDAAAFITPVRRLNTNPGHPNYDRRYDVYAGSTFSDWIDVQDLSTLATRKAAMFAGARIFNGPVCTAHPTLND